MSPNHCFLFTSKALELHLNKDMRHSLISVVEIDANGKSKVYPCFDFRVTSHMENLPLSLTLPRHHHGGSDPRLQATGDQP